MSFVKIRYKRMCLFRYILVCRLDSFVSAFSLLFNHDFGVICSPFGARVFVVQMAVCGTKTHLAVVRNDIFVVGITY